MNARNTKKSLLFLAGSMLFTVSSRALNNDLNPKPISEMLEVDSVYNKAKNNFNDYTLNLYEKVNDTTLNYESFKQGVTGYLNMYKRKEVTVERYLTLIDFTKPSTEKRLYIFDVCEQKLAYKSVVSHGQKSGGLYAEKFSNEQNSHQSSIGFYVTTSTYKSSKYDLALRLDGKEYTNSRASSRGVVMHGAKYATYEFLEQNGRLGRSYGCPAMPYENFDKVVNWIKNGSCLYIYYPNSYYKRKSKYLNSKAYLEDFVYV
jgi:hypothetical protein